MVGRSHHEDHSRPSPANLEGPVHVGLLDSEGDERRELEEEGAGIDRDVDHHEGLERPEDEDRVDQRRHDQLPPMASRNGGAA